MKNIKIKLKLIISFAIMLAITAASGAIGIVGMLSLSRADTRMYTQNVLAVDTLGLIRENFALQRLAYRNLMLYEAQSATYSADLQKLSDLESQMEIYITDYTNTITEKEDREQFTSFSTEYYGGFLHIKEQITQLTAMDDTESAKMLLNETNAKLTDKMIADLDSCYEYNLVKANAAVEHNSALARRFMFILFAALGAAAALSVFLALYLSRLIGKPISIMTAYFEKVAATGDMSLRPEDQALIEECSKIKDESGVCISKSAAFVNRVLEIGEAMGAVAGGDLTVELALLSEQDMMGISLKKMTESLSGMFGDISNSTVQVSTGSKQIADGSQILAQGATEQASSVEQLTSSISEVSVKIRENADMAANASKLASSIKHDAEKGSSQMEHMLAAVKDIEEASASISRVIKVIDDIAFQTNILALNAAVEAARAGQHGKGFAVVAEEVRNLAAKSAEAAKNTGGLIANSMEKSELGAQIAAETAASLSEIVSGINESGRIIADIARSSEEQAVAIAQINKGVEQVGQVIQQNSATAEQAAAASEEMSEQAALLEKMASRFKVKGERLRPAAAQSKPVKHIETGETGKY